MGMRETKPFFSCLKVWRTTLIFLLVTISCAYPAETKHFIPGAPPHEEESQPVHLPYVPKPGDPPVGEISHNERFYIDNVISGDANPEKKDDERKFDGSGDAIKIIQKMSRSSDVYTRGIAMGALPSASSPAEIVACMDSLASTDAFIRSTALETLKTTDSIMLRDAVLDTLAQNRYPAAGALADVLPSLRGALEDSLIKVLEDQTAPIERRRASAFCLGRFGGARAAKTLSQHVWTPIPELDTVCAEAVVFGAEPSTLSQLAVLTSHPLEYVRWAAHQGIAMNGSPEAINMLNQLVAQGLEPSPSLRRELVTLLGVPGDETSITVLVTLLRQDTRMRQHAIRSLEQLTGLQLGHSAEQWFFWYQHEFSKKLAAQETQKKEEEEAESQIEPLTPNKPAVPPGFTPSEEEPSVANSADSAVIDRPSDRPSMVIRKPGR